MKKSTIYLLLAPLFLISCKETQSQPAKTYKLIWSDEFNKDGAVDTGKWRFEKGFVRNQEFQWYQQDNAWCEKGLLIIEVRREQKPNPNYQAGSDDWRKKNATINYTSSSINTSGKHSWQYGRFIMRGRINIDPGLWPAWWTLGTKGRWPSNGEIDIMEYLGHETNKMYGTLHYGASSATHGSKGSFYTLGSGTFYDQFHVFSMTWKQDEIKLYVDNTLFLTVTKTDVGTAPYPFNNPFFFIFNVAVGGNWPGSPDATTTFPQRMIVDYVRVFQ